MSGVLNTCVWIYEWMEVTQLELPNCLSCAQNSTLGKSQKPIQLLLSVLRMNCRTPHTAFVIGSHHPSYLPLAHSQSGHEIYCQNEEVFERYRHRPGLSQAQSNMKTGWLVPQSHWALVSPGTPGLFPCMHPLHRPCPLALLLTGSFLAFGSQLCVSFSGFHGLPVQ
jgi:hypothetical protein